MSRRNTKYPNLIKELNIKNRQSEIDCDYIKGVIDSNGKTVIRALNEEELEWLNKFNGEYVNADFYSNPETHAINDILTILQSEKNLTKKDLLIHDFFFIFSLFVKDWFNLHDENGKKERISANNHRNNDVLVNKLTNNEMFQFDEDQYSEEYESNLYENNILASINENYNLNS